MSRWVKCDALGCTNEAGPLTDSDELLIGWVKVEVEICVGHHDEMPEREELRQFPGGSPLAMLIGNPRGGADQHRRYGAFCCSAECLVRWAQDRQVEIATSRLPDAVE